MTLVQAHLTEASIAIRWNNYSKAAGLLRTVIGLANKSGDTELKSKCFTALNYLRQVQGQ